MKRLAALLLAFVLTLSLTACGGGGGGGGGGSGGGSGNGGNGENGPADSAEPSESSEDYDARFELFINGEDEWTPFPGKSGVTFECSKEDILAVRPGPSKVEFTGKQVGTVVITATLDGQEAKAFVKVKRMVVGAESDETDPPEEERYYLTYCEPVSHYAYETNGGPDNGGSRVTFDGETHWIYTYESGILIGNWINRAGVYSFTENGQPNAGNMIEQKDSDELFDLNYDYWPCSEFAQQVVGASYDDDGRMNTIGNSTPMHMVYDENAESLPNHTDVTDLYVKSEKVGDVDCHVFKIEQWTFDRYDYYWVDLETGWTLQYARQDRGSDEIDIRWTITSFQIGTP